MDSLAEEIDCSLFLDRGDSPALLNLLPNANILGSTDVLEPIHQIQAH